MKKKPRIQKSKALTKVSVAKDESAPDWSNQELAEKLIASGISVVPVDSAGRLLEPKMLKKYRKEKTPSDDVDMLFENPETLVAVVCGAVSGGLCVLEFVGSAVTKFQKFLNRLPMEIQSRIVKGRHKRRHFILFRSTLSFESRRIAEASPSDPLIHCYGEHDYYALPQKFEAAIETLKPLTPSQTHAIRKTAAASVEARPIGETEMAEFLTARDLKKQLLHTKKRWSKTLSAQVEWLQKQKGSESLMSSIGWTEALEPIDANAKLNQKNGKRVSLLGKKYDIQIEESTQLEFVTIRKRQWHKFFVYSLLWYQGDHDRALHGLRSRDKATLKDTRQHGKKLGEREATSTFVNDGARQTQALTQSQNVLWRALAGLKLSPKQSLKREANDDVAWKKALNSFEVKSSREVFNQKLKHHYFVEDVLVAGEAAVIAGPPKSLKTLIAVDLAISLGTRSPFLGRFHVPHAQRVLVLSAESGLVTLKNAAIRICKSKGMKFSSLETLRWGTVVPSSNDPESVSRFTELLKVFRPSVVVIDPMYLVVGANTLTNLIEMGGQLKKISIACHELGATPVFIHHTKKTAKARNEQKLLQIGDLAGAGIAEFFRQWMLVNRLQDYRGGDCHRLSMNIGGSAGHQQACKVSIREYRNTDKGRVGCWQVAVESFAEIAAQVQLANKKLPPDGSAAPSKAEMNQLAILDYLAAVDRERGATKNELRRNSKGTQMSGSAVNAAVVALLDKSKIREIKHQSTSRYVLVETSS